MITEYRNWANQKVTTQQLAAMDTFTEVLINPVTNLIKLEKKIKKGQLDRIEYYKDSGENDESLIINTLEEQTKRFSVRESYGEYTIETSKEFNLDRDTTPVIFKVLFNYNKFQGYICTQRVDSMGTPIDLDETDKVYLIVDDKYGERDLFTCTYNEDGSLDHIVYMLDEYNDQDWEYFNASNFDELQARFGEEDISYYLTADFLP